MYAAVASSVPYLDLSLRLRCNGGHEQTPQYYLTPLVVPRCRAGCVAAFMSGRRHAASALSRHHWRGPRRFLRWSSPVRLPLCADAGGGQVARGMVGRAKPPGGFCGDCRRSSSKCGPNGAGLSRAAIGRWFPLVARNGLGIEAGGRRVTPRPPQLRGLHPGSWRLKEVQG